MARFKSGLVVSPSLTRSLATKLTFEPSMGIMARRVDKMGLDIRSFREPLKRAIKDVMIPSFRKNFDEQGRPEPWLDIQPDTIRKKHSSRILYTTGRLRRTMGYQNIWTVTQDSAAILDLPESVWYGKVHQEGVEYLTTTGDTAEVDARPFILVQDEDLFDIEEVFSDWLEERAKRAGLTRSRI